jgi:hypothetical protein
MSDVRRRLSYAQKYLLRKIPDGKELLVVGSGWADYYAVEPDQIEPELQDSTRWRDNLVGVRGPTIDALIKIGALVLRRQAFDRTRKPGEHGWLRRWYRIEVRS